MPADAPQTTARTNANQNSLVTHAVLVGLTPLIPVPFVDDLVKAHLLRRMVIALAASHARSVRPQDVETLIEDRGGCALGCLGQVVLYPLKKIFRKVFFFLEWKRAVDLTSRTYHQGYLIDYALSSDAIFGAKTMAEIRDAIDAVCRESPVKPLESAIGATFRKSRGVLRSAAQIFAGALKRRGDARPDRQQVAEVVDAVEEQEEREIAPVTTGLQRAVANIPEEHFRRLRTRLDARLGIVRNTPA